MSFRRLQSQFEQWSAFLAANVDSTAGLSRLSAQLASADRFDDLLQRGVSDAGDSIVELSSLDELEWAFLKSLVERYSMEWESYFDPLIYVGYHQEKDRRTWTPSTLPMTDHDMSRPHVVIHFWAPWNMCDREFDANLRPVVRRLQRQTAFRSINVNSPLCADAFTQDDALNVPTLAFYNNGHRHHSTAGIRTTADIEDEISGWLADSNAR